MNLKTVRIQKAWEKLDDTTTAERRKLPTIRSFCLPSVSEKNPQKNAPDTIPVTKHDSVQFNSIYCLPYILYKHHRFGNSPLQTNIHIDNIGNNKH
jgi:hypothetical protein